jgi:hypothetical protein
LTKATLLPEASTISLQLGFRLTAGEADLKCEKYRKATAKPMIPKTTLLIVLFIIENFFIIKY